jgi:hypothetical protein
LRPQRSFYESSDTTSPMDAALKERVGVTAKDTAREVWILLDHTRRKQTPKRPKYLFFRISQPS